MKNLYSTYKQYKSILLESVEDALNSIDVNQLKKQADSFLLNYKKMLIELLKYIGKIKKMGQSRNFIKG